MRNFEDFLTYTVDMLLYMFEDPNRRLTAYEHETLEALIAFGSD